MTIWDDSTISKLSMLLYLNDGIDGGKTRLFSSNGESGGYFRDEYVDISPIAGSALFFRHGFGPGSVMHMGTLVNGENPKYVARMNVMYSQIQGKSQ